MRRAASAFVIGIGWVLAVAGPIGTAFAQPADGGYHRRWGPRGSAPGGGVCTRRVKVCVEYARGAPGTFAGPCIRSQYRCAGPGPVVH